MNTIVLTCKASNNRLDTLEERLNKGGIYDYRIFNAIEYDDFSDTLIEEIGNGQSWFNCSLMKNEKKIKARKSVYLSHIAILADCIDKGINEVLVLEDDITFIDIDIQEINLETIGDDMTTDQREKAQEVVVPVILTRIASMAAFMFRRG